MDQNQINAALAANAQNRALVVANAQPMRQNIWSEVIGNITLGTGLQRNIQIRNVGLIRRLFIVITATITAGAQNLTLQPLGPSNVLSNVTFNDYSNYQRVNTAGWHLHAVATAKNKANFGAAFTNDGPVAWGAAGPAVISAPGTINSAGNANISMIYEVPFAYSDTDLTGAVLANVVNANAYITMTFNPAMLVASGVNPVQSVYQSAGAAPGTVTNVTLNVYQDYLDQLPQTQLPNGQLGMLLPAIDLATVYGIYNTQITGLAANADNPINYTNYRRFLSTYCVYDNAGVLSTTGADVNRWKLVAANMTNIFDLPPNMVKLDERKMLMDSAPVGTYYFSHRDKPIDTKVNGNMQLVLNPAVVTNSQSQVLIGFEYLGLQNQLAQAGSVLQ